MGSVKINYMYTDHLLFFDLSWIATYCLSKGRQFRFLLYFKRVYCQFHWHVSTFKEIAASIVFHVWGGFGG